MARQRWRADAKLANRATDAPADRATMKAEKTSEKLEVVKFRADRRTTLAEQLAAWANKNFSLAEQRAVENAGQIGTRKNKNGRKK